MRNIDRNEIIDTVRKLCIDAALHLPCDVLLAIKSSKEKETNELAKSVFAELEENAKIASELETPICQDTGVAIVFVELGREIYLDYDIYEAINEGVRRGYTDGYLRKSIVRHPIDRVNTGDNTPCIIHLKIVAGDKIKITVAPKGGGSENMSIAKIFPPAVGMSGIVDFVKETVVSAGANPCPPIILGVGVGGTMEYAAYMSKKALLREIGDSSTNPFDKELEEKILEVVNLTNIGPGGYGGDTTCLAVFVESHPCHIASLPVAISIQCHAARHKEAVI